MFDIRIMLELLLLLLLIFIIISNTITLPLLPSPTITTITTNTFIIIIQLILHLPERSSSNTGWASLPRVPPAPPTDGSFRPIGGVGITNFCLFFVSFGLRPALRAVRNSVCFAKLLENYYNYCSCIRCLISGVECLGENVQIPNATTDWVHCFYPGFILLLLLLWDGYSIQCHKLVIR